MGKATIYTLGTEVITFPDLIIEKMNNYTFWEKTEKDNIIIKGTVVEIFLGGDNQLNNIGYSIKLENGLTVWRSLYHVFEDEISAVLCHNDYLNMISNSVGRLIL